MDGAPSKIEGVTAAPAIGRRAPSTYRTQCVLPLAALLDAEPPCSLRSQSRSLYVGRRPTQWMVPSAKSKDVTTPHAILSDETRNSFLKDGVVALVRVVLERMARWGEILIDAESACLTLGRTIEGCASDIICLNTDDTLLQDRRGPGETVVVARWT